MLSETKKVEYPPPLNVVEDAEIVIYNDILLGEGMNPAELETMRETFRIWEPKRF